jgi:molecular chaperone GrpE
MLSLVLGVLDNLERAMAFGGAADGPAKPLLEGIRMAHRQILDQIKALGVRPIEAAGASFDPRLHEAVAVVPAEQAHQPAGTVAGEVLRGYLLNEDVLRPAKVAVVGESTEREQRSGGR